MAAVSISSPMFHSGTGLDTSAAGSTAVALGALGATEAPFSGALVDPDPDPADDSSSIVPPLAGTGDADGGAVVHTGVEGLDSGRNGLQNNPDFLRLALDPAPPPPILSVCSAKARAEGSALEVKPEVPLAAAPSNQQMVADVWGGGLEDAPEPEPRSAAPPGPATRLEAYPSWSRALSLPRPVPLSSKRSTAATTEATSELFSIANPLLRGGRTETPTPSEGPQTWLR